MKIIQKSTILILVTGCVLMLGQSAAFAQEEGSATDDTTDIGEVYMVVEQQPQLIGGLDTLQNMINYPDSAEKAGVEGRVYVQFVVTKEGNVYNPEVLRGPGAGLDQEALRVVKKAKFKPGMQRGKPVNVRYNLPIIFSLQ